MVDEHGCVFPFYLLIQCLPWMSWINASAKCVNVNNLHIIFGMDELNTFYFGVNYTSTRRNVQLVVFKQIPWHVESGIGGVLLCGTQVIFRCWLTARILLLMAALVRSCGNWCCTGCWFETKCSLAIISMWRRERAAEPPSHYTFIWNCLPSQLLPYQTHTGLDTWPTRTHTYTHLRRVFTHKMKCDAHTLT